MLLSLKIIILFLLNLPINTYSFNCDKLILRANLCKLTYRRTPFLNFTKTKLLYNYNNFTYLKDCYIFNNEKTIDVCFRGTHTFNDICFNLNIYPKSFINSKMKVHNGFLQKYLVIRDNLIKNIDEIIKNNNIDEIYFNGHSSGGAVANIASLDLINIYPNITINCITFGSPRVANRAFIEEYNRRIKNSIRIVNSCDIVQFVPLPIIYHHIHEPLILYNKKPLNLKTYIKDNHGLNSYIKNLVELPYLNI